MIEFIVIIVMLWGPIVKLELDKAGLEKEIQELNVVVNENGFQAFHCQNNLNACEGELEDVKRNNKSKR